jgi:hypothetical protein
MRATSMRRLIGGAAALSLVGAMLLSTGSTVLAGETRDITIVMTPLNGLTAGGVTKTDITITNVSGHTLSNAHFLIGLDHALNTSDITVVSVFNDSSGLCPTVTTPVTTYDCAYGNIGAKANQKVRTLSVAFGVGSVGAHTINVELKVAETGSDVGSNTNYKTASVSVTPSAASCNSLATYKLPGDGTLVIPTAGADCATSDTQRSGLLVPANDNGNVVSVDDTILATSCSLGFTCIGNQIDGSVNGGAPVTPYLKWTIFYSNSVLGSVPPNKVAFLHDGTIILAGNKGLCKTDTSVDCQEPYKVEAGGVWFYVRTQTNGVIKGMN